MSDRDHSPNDANEDALAPSGSRLLMVAFACHPDNSMEERNGWSRALQAAADFDVTVVCSPTTDVNELTQRVPHHLLRRIKFFPVSAGVVGDYFLSKEFLFYQGYRIWHSRVLRFAKELHADFPFAISHLVSICGYREPGYVWQLDCPFVWGPVGGTSNFPLKFLSILDPLGSLFEITRNAVNWCQLRYRSRIHRAALKAATVFAANRSSQNDLERNAGVRLHLELEAGIDYEVAAAKELTTTDRPLRILWVGRLRPWKGLPLLLYALAKLPELNKFELRIVGDGGCKAKWMQLAKRLGVDNRVSWIIKPPYRESLHHYEWADAFAFTSLRDTSGTGLLESLAAGVPIVGLDHQGCADIINESCGIRIPVVDPQQCISAFAQALVELSNDRQRLQNLSRGAVERACAYTWSQRDPLVRSCYAAATTSNGPIATQPEPALAH